MAQSAATLGENIEAKLENIFREPGQGLDAQIPKVTRDLRKLAAIYRCTAELVEEPTCSRFKEGLRGCCTFASVEHGMKSCNCVGVL